MVWYSMECCEPPLRLEVLVVVEAGHRGAVMRVGLSTDFPPFLSCECWWRLRLAKLSCRD